MKLNELIRAGRINLGITQAEAGSAIGVGQTHICHWESGLRSPSTENFLKIARAYSPGVDAFLRGEFKPRGIQP